MKFGGRWLYQRQGFWYSGNEGILGHYNYTGAFTGFGFSDFLLDKVSQKGMAASSDPFTQMRTARRRSSPQDDFRVRNNLTLNLGLSWEYPSPMVEVDDRQSEHRLQHRPDCCSRGRTAPAERCTIRTTADWSHGSASRGLPRDKWVVRGAFGIVQYMEGTGKNLRLPANPPFYVEGQRTTT